MSDAPKTASASLSYSQEEKAAMVAALDRFIASRALVDSNEASLELEDAADEGDLPRARAAIAQLTPKQVRATDSAYMAAIGGFTEIVELHRSCGFAQERDISRLESALMQAVAKGHLSAANALLALFAPERAASGGWPQLVRTDSGRLRLPRSVVKQLQLARQAEQHSVADMPKIAPADGAGIPLGSAL